MEQRRVFLAILLSFVVLYAYQALVVKPIPKPADPSTSSGQVATTTAATPAAATSPAATGTQPSPAVTPSTSAAVVAETPSPLVGDTSERDVRVETQDVIAVFTTRGARLKSWRLKHFFNDDKRPLELVAVDLAATHPLPFSLETEDTRVTADINGGIYTVTGEPSGNAAESSPTDLRFEYSDTSGVHAVKEFHLEPASYVIGFKTSVTANDKPLAPAMVWGPALGDVAHDTGRYATATRGMVFTGGKVQRFTAANIAKTPTQDGEFKYTGVDDHYFVTVALLPASSHVAFQAVSIPPPDPKGTPRDLVSYSVTPPPPQVFFGPKDFDVLAGVDRDLVRAIDYGMFSVIVVPLLRSLKWVNGYVGNWGWSIVVLTILINVVMFPLRHKSVVSMRKMQEIQPEIKAIQDRYSKLKSTDPAKQKMNQEMMALYKDRGVNPASGCVPILLTMPVMLAFWSLLNASIELRGAPFFGWIHDLSVFDPIYVFPVLMGLSQVVQTRMMPAAAGADPTQQKMMMYMMPVFMTFIFLRAPAGLAVYYFVSNVWGIGQQYLTNRIIGPPVVRTLRPAAERQLKRAGSGKTDAAAKEK